MIIFVAVATVTAVVAVVAMDAVVAVVAAQQRKNEANEVKCFISGQVHHPCAGRTRHQQGYSGWDATWVFLHKLGWPSSHPCAPGKQTWWDPIPSKYVAPGPRQVSKMVQ